MPFPYKKGHHLSVPNPLLSTMCSGNYVVICRFFPHSLWTELVLLVYFTNFSAGWDGVIERLREAPAWWLSTEQVGIDETRTILNCWPNQISPLMWQNHMVVNVVPVGIYLCSLGHFLVLVQAGSWCTRCWKAHVEIAKALSSPGAWHHPAGTELVLGSSGKASFRWCCILSRQVLNLAFLLYATRKQRFMSQLHDI